MKKLISFFILISIFCTNIYSETSSKSFNDTSIVVHQPAIKTVFFPEVGIENEVEIGRTIVSKARKVTRPAISIQEDILFKVEPSFFSNSWSGVARINRGTMALYVTTPDGSFYRDEKATFNFSGNVVRAEAGVFIPKDANNPSVPWYVSKRVFYFGAEPVAVEKTEIITWGQDSFSKELIYGGIAQNTITISYREFIDGTARPAFLQELKYDLSQGDEIGFRGARFKIIRANNIGLLYKVLKPLD